MTYKANELITVYGFDQEGHYTGEVLAQVDPKDKILLVPDNCVTFSPGNDGTCYYTISEDKTQWIAHKWPGAAADCVGIFIEHTDHCQWAEKMRTRFEELCEASTKYHVVRDEGDLCMTVEAIPEKTAEELAEEAAEQELQDFDAQLSSLKDRMALAQLMGDTEQVAALQAEYKKLMEA